MWALPAKLGLGFFGEAAHLRVVQIVRQYGVFLARLALNFFGLTGDIALVFGADFDLADDLCGDVGVKLAGASAGLAHRSGRGTDRRFTRRTCIGSRIKHHPGDAGIIHRRALEQIEQVVLALNHHPQDPL